jgi:hypothetical protein
VTTPSLVLAMTIGAAALALWTYSRFQTLTPGFRASLAHMFIALALLNLLVPAVMEPIIGDGDSAPRLLAALFAVFLPALAYAFLSGLWAFAGLTRAFRLH